MENLTCECGGCGPMLWYDDTRDVLIRNVTTNRTLNGLQVVAARLAAIPSPAPQHVTFENIRIIHPFYRALDLNAFNWSAGSSSGYGGGTTAPTDQLHGVDPTDGASGIVFRNIVGIDVVSAGHFFCAAASPCSNITLDRVVLRNAAGQPSSGYGCSGVNGGGVRFVESTPASCAQGEPGQLR